MHAVDPDYVAQDGEVLFPDYASPEDLAAAFPGYAEPVEPPAKVLKSTVMARLTAPQMAAAWGMLMANPVMLGKWFAPDKPFVNATDPDAISFVKALNLDPSTILAP